MLDKENRKSSQGKPGSVQMESVEASVRPSWVEQASVLQDFSGPLVCIYALWSLMRKMW